MKYCRSCGMLLEDTHERCIKCGADVSIASNVSMYPPEVEAKMAAEKEENKSKSKMVAILIAIVVIVVFLVGVAIWKISKGGMTLPEPSVKPETVSEVDEEPASEIAETEEAAPVVEKDVKDDAGSYYICTPQFDAAGNHVFNAIYPEDITNLAFNVDLEKYSNQFPECIVFTAANDDESVTFTYMSPQQLWYKKSDKGYTRKNERDPQYYMSFLQYEDAKSYLEMVIKASYPKAKKIEMVSESDASEALTASLEQFSKERQDFFLNKKIGDYAHLGADTEYASNGSADFSAKVFEYQITDPTKEVMYCKYYVPIIANSLLYATETGGDMGTITEWYVLCVCGFETGNDMLYEDYQSAFDLFCANAAPTREFFFTNSQFGKAIEESIEAEVDPEALDETKLKEYGSKFKADAEIGDIREKIYDYLHLYGSKVFSSENMTIRTMDDVAVSYYDKEAGKLFVSPDESEYPGSSYEELVLKSE